MVQLFVMKRVVDVARLCPADPPTIDLHLLQMIVIFVETNVGKERVRGYPVEFARQERMCARIMRGGLAQLFVASNNPPFVPLCAAL